MTLGPEKCVVVLKIPYINKSSVVLDNKIRQLIRKTWMQQTQGLSSYQNRY